jgi:hypothetical protein
MRHPLYEEYAARAAELGLEVLPIEAFPTLRSINIMLNKINKDFYDAKRKRELTRQRLSLEDRRILRKLVMLGKLEHTMGTPWNLDEKTRKILEDERIETHRRGAGIPKYRTKLK